MKINAMRAFLISAFIIIILYVLGLFLPIIINSKQSSELYDSFEIKISSKLNNKIIFL